MAIFDGTEISRRKRDIPTVWLQASRHIRLNAEAAAIFLQPKKATHLLLDWDSSTRVLDLLASDGSDPRAYKVDYRSGGGATFSVKAFLTYIDWPKNLGARLQVTEAGRGRIRVKFPNAQAEGADPPDVAATSGEVRAEKAAKRKA
jgi:hypothetical protein